ncbi:MAG TPA: hypothetical protein VGM50_12125 [Gemmatimonadaceae bacterium]|jgi:hypothetical protein
MERRLFCERKVAVRAYRGASGTQCLTQVVLDGTVVSRGRVIDDRDPPPGATKAVRDQFEAIREKGWWNSFDLNSINVASLAAIELYRSGADAQDTFGGADAACGVLVLWTRRA